MLMYHDISKKCHVAFKNIFVFLKAFKLFSISGKIQVNQLQFSVQKKFGGGDFTPTSPLVITNSKYVGENGVN